MGFWSTLGKYALPALGIAAAPFTGGASLLSTLGLSQGVASAIGAGAGIAGNMAKGASAQRAQDRGAQGEYDLARIPLQNRQAMDLAELQQLAEKSRYKQLGSTDMLSSMQRPSDPRAQKYLAPGGRTPSGGEISPDTLQMIRQRALDALQSGSDVPKMEQMPERPGGGPTGTDSFLSTLGMVGNVTGALGESGLLNRRTPQMPAAPTGTINDLPGALPPGQEIEAPPWSPLGMNLNPKNRRYL